MSLENVNNISLLGGAAEADAVELCIVAQVRHLELRLSVGGRWDYHLLCS